MAGFEMLDAETIQSGRATDAYFLRTEETLEHAGKNPRVSLEVTADQFPTGEFEVFAGVKDAAALFEGMNVDVDALREGQLFDGGPVMRIRGRYRTIARYETALLGFLSQAAGFATRALRARLAAPDTHLYSFGSRHVHPAIAPVVERSALIAGFDGFSHVAAGDVLDRAASGTMPHALLLVFGRGNQEEAWVAFNDAMDPSVPRIALCDTFSDEMDEVLRAVESLGADLESVRIDTTGSRRGNFQHILKELRWELDRRGRDDVDIFASGGLGAAELATLQDVASGFGVGSYITDADPVDFALDIVSVEGESISKRGKLAGRKAVYRTATGEHAIRLIDHEPPADAEPLLHPLLRSGEIVREFDLTSAARRARADAATVGF